MEKPLTSNDMMPYSMLYIETGKGWKPIAQKVIDAIIEYNNTSPDDSSILIDQIKEKFGTLCIYLTYNNVPEEKVKEIQKIIAKAKAQANNTCEICGAIENLGIRTNGWYTVMCEKCAEKIVEENKFYGAIGIKWRRFSDGKIIYKQSTKDQNEIKNKPQ